MAKVSVTASLGVKLKWFSDYENVNPHASVTIERDVEGTDEELLEQADVLYDKCRAVVQKKIGADVKSAKGEKVTVPNG